MNKRIFKSEKGSITLYVLISMIFFLIVVTALYVSSSNKVRAEESQIRKIQQQYEKQDANDLYQKAIEGNS